MHGMLGLYHGCTRGLMHIYVIIRRDHVNNNGKNIGGALALWG
jgi:hypothetical protein